MNITLLEQREIEAKIVGPIFEAFAKEIGEARAREILAGVIRQLAQRSGEQAAQRSGGAELLQLGGVIETWNQGQALEIEMLRKDEGHLDFNVTRCRFAEMYRRLGLEHLGAILSCNRDAAMIEGFNSEIDFSRTQTLMEGAPHCNFRYSQEERT
jgi:predicted ArsR family transcriptional regulator